MRTRGETVDELDRLHHSWEHDGVQWTVYHHSAVLPPERRAVWALVLVVPDGRSVHHVLLEHLGTRPGHEAAALAARRMHAWQPSLDDGVRVAIAGADPSMFSDGRRSHGERHRASAARSPFDMMDDVAESDEGDDSMSVPLDVVRARDARRPSSPAAHSAKFRAYLNASRCHIGME